jgi:GxxExxY protein
MALAINQLTARVIGLAIAVHEKLGPGLLEKPYELCLAYELERNGLKVEEQKPIAIVYDDLIVEDAFRIDLLVEDCLIVELKAKRELDSIDEAQIISYLRLMKLQVGLLINFHEVKLVDGVRRVVNRYED